MKITSFKLINKATRNDSSKTINSWISKHKTERIKAIFPWNNISYSYACLTDSNHTQLNETLKIFVFLFFSSLIQFSRELFKISTVFNAYIEGIFPLLIIEIKNMAQSVRKKNSIKKWHVWLHHHHRSRRRRPIGNISQNHFIVEIINE
jgi:hypothetical protein